MMVKSGQVKNIFEIPPCPSHFLLKEFISLKAAVLIKNTNSIIKMTWCMHGGISKFVFLKEKYTLFKKNLVVYFHRWYTLGCKINESQWFSGKGRAFSNRGQKGTFPDYNNYPGMKREQSPVVPFFRGGEGDGTFNGFDLSSWI